NPAEKRLVELIDQDAKASAAAYYHETYLPAREAGMKLAGGVGEKIRRYTAHDMTVGDSTRYTGVTLVLSLVVCAIFLGWLQARGIQRALHRSIAALDALAGKTATAADQIAQA